MDLQIILAEIEEAIHENKMEEAERKIKDLEDKNIESPELLSAKVILLLSTGKTTQAESLLRHGVFQYPEYADLYYNLGFLYFGEQEYLKSAICYAAFAKYSDDSECVKEIETQLKEMSNLYVVFDDVRKNDESDYVIFTGSNDSEKSRYDFIARILRNTGKNVWFFTFPVVTEVNGFSYQIHDLIKVVFDNLEERDGIKIIHPLLLNGKNQEFDTAPYVMKEISDHYSPNKHVGVVCPSQLIEKICELDSVDNLGNKFEVIFAPHNHKAAGVPSFAFFGDFYQTLNRLYNVNIVKDSDPSKTLISIVVPTRNNPEALEYTLKSCLNQRIKDYEIVVSDNSSAQNNNTYELIKKLNDDRIKYYRPERELRLKENFEFAFLKAKGEFIFSIGSDDGVLFHGLEILQKALEAYPEEDIFFWDRLFYCWPGFINKGQEDLLIIPRIYSKGPITASYLDCNSSLQAVISLRSSMYSLPMLYINSGFRRRYLHKLIEKTGKLLDGFSQDVYMGLVNYAINDKILYLQCPITVAGMTSKSTGATMMQFSNSETAKKEFYEKYKRVYSQYVWRYDVKYLPQDDVSDIYLLFYEYLKICQKNIDPKFSMSNLDKKKMYSSCTELLGQDSALFRQFLSAYFDCVKLLKDKNLTLWYKNTYYNNPNFHGSPYTHPDKKTYIPGYHGKNGLLLDASKFGVKEVYGACELFDKLFNL